MSLAPPLLKEMAGVGLEPKNHRLFFLTGSPSHLLVEAVSNRFYSMFGWELLFPKTKVVTALINNDDCRIRISAQKAGKCQPPLTPTKLPTNHHHQHPHGTRNYHHHHHRQQPGANKHNQKQPRANMFLRVSQAAIFKLTRIGNNSNNKI